METPLQFAFRTQKSIGLLNAAPVYEPLQDFDRYEGTSRCCIYSPCGRYFAWGSLESVTVIDSSSGTILNTFPVSNVYEIEFSAKGTFLVTWERLTKDDAGNASPNLKVWKTLGHDIPIGSFVQKSQGGLNLQYTADERYCARLATNEIHFFESLELGKVWGKVRAESVSDFALSPGLTNSVAVFIPEHKGQPATVKVFNFPDFINPISQKKFFKGDKVQLKWNKCGLSLLVLAQTEVDKSNKSYYGETTLYLLSANGRFDARVGLDKEGPIHDVSWSPNSCTFGVVYGYMPAKTTLFNTQAVATHSFPIGPRNTLIFSPTGRFAIIAGFGNLAGQMDVYDLERDFAKICTIESGSPSVCHWSPDSRYIMTATTSPRLRVDNGVKLWHVTGNLVYIEDMVELYNILWRPAFDSSPAVSDPLNPLPRPHSSAVAYLGAKTPVKSAGAYRPPGARGLATPLVFKREDEGGAAHLVGNGTYLTGANGFGRARRTVPGADPADSSNTGINASVSFVDPLGGDDALSKTALKNKKKRSNKKIKDPADLQQNPESTNDVPLVRPPTDRSLTNSDIRSQERQKVGHHGGYNTATIARANPSLRGVRSDSFADKSLKPVTKAAAPLPSTPGSPERANGEEVEGLTKPATAPDSPQNPNAKKIRSLTKKIRAIEELEMRHAGGEKLEDTQIKKITTKQEVMRELDALELSMSRENSGGVAGGLLF